MSESMDHVAIANQAKAIMMDHVSDPRTIPALAKECGTSPTVLKQSFKEVFGVPIYSWYRNYRMTRAAEMLAETDMTVFEVAYAVGYSNPSKFSHAFADCMGLNPRAWRQAHLESIREQ